MAIPSLTWIDVKNRYEDAEREVGSFFMDLQGGKIDEANGVRVSYRDGQHYFASAVMNAIKNKEILLVEAGVGTGKSIGYLLPIFYTMKNVTKFKKVIISTSSIALQEQLKGDVLTVSKLLGMNIRTEVSKGINNYACMEKIKMAIDASRRNGVEEDAYIFQNIKDRINEIESCDKSEFKGLDNAFWKRIQVSGGCDKCVFREACYFLRQQARIGEAPIVITNHTHLANLIDSNSELVSDADAIVIDEAHNFDEEIRLSTEQIINLDKVRRIFEVTIRDGLKKADSDTYYEMMEYDRIYREVVKRLTKCYVSFNGNAKYRYRKDNPNGQSIENVDRLNINIENTTIQRDLALLNRSLMPMRALLLKINGINNKIIRYSLGRDIDYILKCIELFKDMSKGYGADNIYWVKYYNDEHIEIVYSKKDLSDFYGKLYHEGRGITFTSGTLTTVGNYNRMVSSLGLEGNSRLVLEDPVESPFDYASNSIFYYDDNMTPFDTEDRTKYITDVAIRVKELISVTSGKALVLFTSKSDMRAVYDIVSHMGLEQKMILQEDTNTMKWKNEFESDIDSCLFATGAFWEGIDLKGKTLSNLIIVKLPFPVQDPIVNYKTQKLSRKEAGNLIVNEMLIKLSQGAGRAIRSEADTAVVCCLDSRITAYLDLVQATLPFTVYTNDINEICDL